MYIWRIPALWFAPLVTGVALLAVAAVLVGWRDAAKSRGTRGVLLALVVLVHVLSPFAATGPSPVLLRVLPAILVPVVLFVAHRVFPSALGYRVAFFALVSAFAVMNVANWCQPGWCELFGFPLPYSWWSDAIVVLNGQSLSSGWSVMAFLANVGALVLAVFAMSRRNARRRAA